MEAEAVGERIERMLRVLVGLPLRSMGRAGDMAWLGFGDWVELPKFGGGTRMVAKHALHLSCPFRLAGPAGAIAAAHDMYHSSEDPNDDADDFEWDCRGANWYDKRVSELLAAIAADPPVVERVEGDDFGGFRLWLSGVHSLAVFPATSFRREHWRYFQPGNEDEHFVIFREHSH